MLYWWLGFDFFLKLLLSQFYVGDDFAIWHPRVMKVLKDQAKIRKKGRECETDDRSCPLSEHCSPGVNIAFPCLLQLQACSLVHLLQRVKMEERDTPVGWWEYRPPSQGCETQTHTHTHLACNCCHIFSVSLVKVILICVCVLQSTKKSLCLVSS